MGTCGHFRRCGVEVVFGPRPPRPTLEKPADGAQGGIKRMGESVDADGNKTSLEYTDKYDVASVLLALVITIFTTSARVRAQDAQTPGIVGSWIVSSPDGDVNLVIVHADGTAILAAKI